MRDSLREVGINAVDDAKRFSSCYRVARIGSMNMYDAAHGIIDPTD